MTAVTAGAGTSGSYRMIDFRRDKTDIPAKVTHHRVRPEPLGAHRAAELRRRREALHPGPAWPEGGRHRHLERRRPTSSRATRCRWRNIPLGTLVHNIELQAGKGGQMVRSAGTYAQLMAKEGDYAQVRLPSGEVRQVLIECRATIGQVGNVDAREHQHRQGRPHPLAGQAPARARRGHEPGRPPHGRRRRQDLGRPPPLHPLGHADQGLQDAQEQDHRQVHRQAAQEDRGEGTVARSIKKGPVRRRRTWPRRSGGRWRAGAARSSRPGRAAPPSSRSSSGIPSPCTTARSSSRCSSPRTWSATSWASSRRRGRSTATPATARPRAK